MYSKINKQISRRSNHSSSRTIKEILCFRKKIAQKNVGKERIDCILIIKYNKFDI